MLLVSDTPEIKSIHSTLEGTERANRVVASSHSSGK